MHHFLNNFGLVMKKILPLLLIGVLILINSCSDPTEVSPIETVQLEEKIGQMLLIGFRGLSVTDDSQIARDVMSGRIGGVVLYDRDVALGSSERNIQSPEQVKKLISTLQSYAEIKLFVAVDQEGGSVNRLKQKFGFPATVSQQYLGTLDNPDSTNFYASRTGYTLNSLGFNLNFAPVVDVNINPESPAIGKIGRSFSADPAIVSKHARIEIDALHNYLILATLKHFPGHGSAASDSHLGFTDVTSTWQDIELLPYKNLIGGGFNDVVMTAHIFNANLDPYYPATLSKNIITGILRNEIGFKGVIISDDMNMAAITSQYGLEQAIELSVNAGVDILIFANNLTYNEQIAVDAVRIIKSLVESGRITQERINQSYNRIMTLKGRLL